MVLASALLLAASQMATDLPADSCAQAIRLSLDGQRAGLIRAAEELGAQRPHFFLPAALPIRLCVDSLPVLRSWGVLDRPRRAVASPLEVKTVQNSAYPKSVNDGLLWAGVGTSVVLSGGLELQWRWLTVGLKPIAVWQQNADFPIPALQRAGRSRFANAHHPAIDYPDRFGDTSFGSIDPGQSFIRLDAGPVTAAFSHENLWLGASDVYQILLSNTAPGFWHVRLGTRAPVRLAWFEVEVHGLWGALEESDYFDGDGPNDAHLFAGLVVSVETTFVPGLKLGVSRIAHLAERPAGHSLGFYVRRFFDAPTFSRVSTNLPENALGALFVSWTIPEGGFEIHAEWTREDRPYNLQDLLREPDWTQAYGLGFGKLFRGRGSISRFWGEMVHLGESAPVRAGKGFFSYYTHGTVRQGHTHRGQLLGAAIGLGSDAQVLGFDHFRERGLVGGYVQRTRYDEDIYISAVRAALREGASRRRAHRGPARHALPRARALAGRRLGQPALRPIVSGTAGRGYGAARRDELGPGSAADLAT